MQYKNVFEDFFYSTTATTLTYRIEDENGEPVFIGRAVGDSAGTRVNVAQKIRDWLFNEIGDFRESDGEFFDHPDAIHAFSLVDMSDNAVKEQWMVIYSFQPWNGDTLFLTTAINTHASPAQKLFITNGAKIDVPTHRTQEITDGGGGDGPEGTKYFDAQDAVTVPFYGGEVSVPVTTNINEYSIRLVMPEGVTCTGRSSSAFNFNVPANITASAVTYTIEYWYDGVKMDETVVTVSAYSTDYFECEPTEKVAPAGGQVDIWYITTIPETLISATVSAGSVVSLGGGHLVVSIPRNADEYTSMTHEAVFLLDGTIELGRCEIYQGVAHEDEYLTVELEEDGDLNFDTKGQGVGTPGDATNPTPESDAYLEYRINGGSWIRDIYAEPGYAGNNITVPNLNTGDKVEVRSTYPGYHRHAPNISLFTNPNPTVGPNRKPKRFKVYGNPLSFFWGDDFYGKTSTGTGTYGKDRFFPSFISGLVTDASNLILSLPEVCGGWSGYFQLAFITNNYVYSYADLWGSYSCMFIFPTIHYTENGHNYYYGSVLTTGPKILASKLSNSDVADMFTSHVTRIVCMAVSNCDGSTPINLPTLANFDNTEGTFVKRTGADWVIGHPSSITGGIPAGWTVEEV